MEPHDLHSLNLAVDDRLDSLRRSMARQRTSERRARRRVGDAFVAFGVRIAGERPPGREPADAHLPAH